MLQSVKAFHSAVPLLINTRQLELQNLITKAESCKSFIKQQNIYLPSETINKDIKFDYH